VLLCRPPKQQESNRPPYRTWSSLIQMCHGGIPDRASHAPEVPPPCQPLLIVRSVMPYLAPSPRLAPPWRLIPLFRPVLRRVRGRSTAATCSSVASRSARPPSPPSCLRSLRRCSYVASCPSRSPPSSAILDPMWRHVLLCRLAYRPCTPPTSTGQRATPA
jgi:hypothetical protein